MKKRLDSRLYKILLYFIMIPILLSILAPAEDPSKALPGIRTSIGMELSSSSISQRSGLLMLTRQPAVLPIHTHIIPDDQPLDWDGINVKLWIFREDRCANMMTPIFLLPAFPVCAAGIYMRC